RFDEVVCATEFRFAFQNTYRLELAYIERRVGAGCKCAEYQDAGEESHYRRIVKVVRLDFHFRPHDVPSFDEQLGEDESNQQREEANDQGFADKLGNKLAADATHHLADPDLFQPPGGDCNSCIRQVEACDKEDKHTHYGCARHHCNGWRIPCPGIGFLCAIAESHLRKMIQDKFTNDKILFYLVIIVDILLQLFPYGTFARRVIDHDKQRGALFPVVLQYVVELVKEVFEIHECFPAAKAGILRLRLEYTCNPDFLERLTHYLSECTVHHIGGSEQLHRQPVTQENGRFIAQLSGRTIQELKGEHFEEPRVDIRHSSREDVVLKFQIGPRKVIPRS